MTSAVWPRLAPRLAAGLAAVGAGSALRPSRRRPAQAEEVEVPRVRRVAFLGNSYLYFNDVPRLFQALCGHAGAPVEIGDCLRGGTSLKVLMEKGNGMRTKFKTSAALQGDGTYDIGAPTVQALLADPRGWDAVVANTYSQEAARLDRRKDGLDALDRLAPLMKGAGARPVLLVTPAYRAPVKDAGEVGDWCDFTWRQSEGFGLYAQSLAEQCPQTRQPRLADVNQAFQVVHGERPELWEELFHSDDFHPSALGSFLEACVIFSTLFGEVPPLPTLVLQEPSQLWSRARRMLPPPEVGRMPSADELIYLRSVAARVCCRDTSMGLRVQHP